MKKERGLLDFNALEYAVGAVIGTGAFRVTRRHYSTLAEIYNTGKLGKVGAFGISLAVGTATAMYGTLMTRALAEATKDIVSSIKKG